LHLFKHASVGGTFNALHEYHRDYLLASLALADSVHLLLASDSYARERKSYEPRPYDERRKSLDAFFKSLGCADRIEIDALWQISDIQTYVESCERLDLVIAERAYFEWFANWNERRAQSGMTQYYILCQPRTVLHDWPV
jgi:cytidyltransferase-like protein